MATSNTTANDSRFDFGSLAQRRLVTGLLFSLPYLVLFAVFLLYPLIKGLYMSLYNWNAIYPSESTFIGLQNYAHMLGAPAFWSALWSTLYFVILTVPSMVVVSLLLALGVNRDVKGSAILRTIFFSPYILTVSVAALIWTQLLGSTYGLLNVFLNAVGFSNPPAWLQSYAFAMPWITVTTVWWTVGFSFVVLLAARQNVPEQIYEAAKLDGASSWRTMIDITIPQMRNGLFFVIVLNLIWSFQMFGQSYIMTSGGPGQSTTTLVMYLYRQAFHQHNFGYAAAVGYVLTLILIVVSIVNYYFLGGESA